MKLHKLLCSCTIIAIVLFLFAAPTVAQTLGNISVTRSTMDSVKIEFSNSYPPGIPQGVWCLRVQYWSNNPNAKFWLQWPVSNLLVTGQFGWKIWKDQINSGVNGLVRPVLIHADTQATTIAGDGIFPTAWTGTGIDATFAPLLSSMDTVALEIGFWFGDSGYVDFYIDDFNAIYSGNDTLIQSFGDYGNISGFVQYDANNDSSYTAGEMGLENWQVNLLRDDGIDLLAIDSLYTDSAGAFAFHNVVAWETGGYRVALKQKSCWGQTWPNSPDTHYVTISSAGLDTTVTFGAWAEAGFYTYHKRWNLVSNPRSQCEMPTVNEVWSDAITPAYAYNAYGGGGYVIDPTPTYGGGGYWVKMAHTKTVLISGFQVANHTHTLYPGWNLIPVISFPMCTYQLTSAPENNIVSPFYTFSPGGGYVEAPDTLYPGRAYWVKADTAGTLGMDFLQEPSSQAIGRSMPKPEVSRLNSITVTDAYGNARTLRFGTDVPNTKYFSLPPLPPQGAFDARFATHRSVENVPPGTSMGILLQGEPPYMVTYSVEGRWLLAGNTIADTGTFTVEGAYLTLSRGDPTVPAEFALEQNYPNPFNPVTRISYSIPYSGYVTLKIFNIIGQEVATLVQEVKESGTHEVSWNAGNGPSGVYFYRLQAGTRTATAKMILVK